MEAIKPYFTEYFGNPSSIHQLGQQTRKAIEDARVSIANMIGADDPNEIVFTSGGTESNNMAIKGALEVFGHKGKRILASSIEHSAVRSVLKHLAELNLVDHVVIPVQKNAMVKLSDVADALTTDTILVSIMLANNEVGTIQPIKEIAALCKKKNIVMHTDAVQAAGKLSIQVNQLGIDYLSLSGHKFGAPKGVGILYIRKGTQCAGLLQGGKQEKNRRAGTENVPGIVGIGEAARLVMRNLNIDISRLQQLRDAFEKIILTEIPQTFLNGDKIERTCNTANICFPCTDSTELLMALDLKGVIASNGSACIAGSPDPSHVLLAMGLPQDQAHASLRFSFGHGNTEKDIEPAVNIIKETVARLREKHPLWKKSA
jgi:cysteine desulfurase